MAGDGVLRGPNGLIARRLLFATTPRERRRGLHSVGSLEPDVGMLLRPCRQVHTLGMRYPIDAVFCDADDIVLAVQTLRPWRLSRYVRRAKSCFELCAGRAKDCGIEAGVQLVIEGAS